MPILALTPGMVANPTRFSLLVVETTMLWPHDAAKRTEARKTGEVAEIMEEIGTGRLPSTADWMKVAFDATPLRQMAEEGERPFRHGLIAGELLKQAIAESGPNGSVKLLPIKHEIVTREIGEPLKVSFSTLENSIWARYRSASHLWAAYLGAALAGDATFPCQLGRLAEFLAISEWYRAAGMSITLSRRSDETLLSRATTWRLPEGLTLPPVEWP